MSLTEFHYNEELLETGSVWTVQAAGERGADMEILISLIHALSKDQPAAARKDGIPKEAAPFEEPAFLTPAAAGVLRAAAGKAQAPPASCPPKEPKEPKKRRPPYKRNSRQKGKDFIIAATSPDDELYQLEHSGRVSGELGGRYCLYRVNKDTGGLHFFDDPDFKKRTACAEAIAEFRRWASAKGYEIMGGDGADGAERAETAEGEEI